MCHPPFFSSLFWSNEVIAGENMIVPPYQICSSTNSGVQNACMLDARGQQSTWSFHTPLISLYQ